MGTFSIWHWLIVLAVVLLMFGGRGKIPQLMGDVARGIKSFKSNIKDEKEAVEATADQQIEAETSSKDEAAKS
jgi:sec-independent protein translocase protein TatA